MKKIYILSLALAALFASCKKDNYDEPNVKLSGRIVYQGEAINIDQPVSGPSQIELWQPGFGKLAAIQTAIAQDGSYSQALFAGNYKLTMQPGNGPWIWKQNAQGRPDTVYVDLKGDQTLDIEVTPYYMIRNPKFSIAGRTVSADFDLEKIITDANAKNVVRITLYVNKTQFVSNSYSIAKTESTDVASLTNKHIEVELPDISPAQNYVFARIAVSIDGVNRLLYSPVQKLTL